ncbi:hypothetical protein BVG19_g218 [[Candida] boidinii]|nr:hypothetical protein BVG19_g218 [[Candida] boidinii]OWB49797.1 hypothetical protein B5S27_g1341 [[Candida] boidinii]OWB82454.1 hypothetical protein B5S33_g1080 [[Candida] boidinii]
MPSDKVLVTGANGFLASHIVDVLLSKGYKVIGTVRSEAKYEPLLKEFKAKYPQANISFEIVKDIAAANAFDEVLKKNTDIKHVIHTANPVVFGLDKSPEELYRAPAVDGTKNILTAIKDYGGQVENVVITSSHGTMVEFDRVVQPLIDENYWSSLTWDQIGDNDMMGYSASKKLAEEAAWDFMKTQSPHFALTTLTPPYIFGPQVFDSQVGKTLNASNQFLVDALSIDPKTTEAQKGNSTLYVDVRDVASAHVAPLSTTTMSNKRLLPVAGAFCTQSLLDVMNKIPSLKGKVAVGDSSYIDSEEYHKTKSTFNNSLTVKLLGNIEFTQLEKVVSDTIEQYSRVNTV